MSKKTKVFIFLGILLAIVASLFIIIISMKSEIVPEIYAYSNSNNEALAVKMGYSWNSFNGTIIADALELTDIEYKNENMLLALPGEKITIKNSDNSSLSYKFYPESFRYYDKANTETSVNISSDALYKESKIFEFSAPEVEGTYIYHFTLNYYKKGTVTYALKVIVSSAPTYDVSEIINYKNTYIGDAPTVGAILDKLPFAKYRESYALKTASEPYELIINYGELSTSKSSFENSSVALFALIKNLDIISYVVVDNTYVYSRAEIENLVGRDLFEYAENPELWEKEIIFKEKVEKQSSYIDIYKAILSDILSDFGTSNTYAIDISTFEKDELMQLTNAEKRELLGFCVLNANVVYECKYEEFTGNAILVHCIEISNEEEVYTFKVEIIKSGKRTENLYKVQSIEDKWTVEEM